MSALMPFMVLDEACASVLVRVSEELNRAGFRVVQTFDLHVARLAHPDCPCPHHGTDECNCQMVVLLVYRNDSTPTTLVIHGQDGRSWLSLANQTGQRTDPHLEAAIRRATVPRLSEVPSSLEVAYEGRSPG